MTQPPEIVEPQALRRFAPYQVPLAGASIRPPQVSEVPVAEAQMQLDPAQMQLDPAQMQLDPAPVQLDPATMLDPRVAAFGTAPIVQDPPLVRRLLPWAIPAGTAVLGVLLGVAIGASGNRPAAPVSITGPGVTTSVTATQQVTVTQKAATVTRHATRTVAKVTTAPAPPPAPAPPRTVTETVTAERTVYVAGPGGRRQPRLRP